MSRTTSKIAILAMAAIVAWVAACEDSLWAQYRPTVRYRAPVRPIARARPLIRVAQRNRRAAYAYTEISDAPPLQQDAAQPVLAPITGAGPQAGQSGIAGQNTWFGSYVEPYMVPPSGLQGCFFQWDQLLWNLATQPSVTVIGSTAAEGTVDVGGTEFFLSNDMDTDLDNGNLHSGQRFEFGHTDGYRGWFFSVMFGDGTRRGLGTSANFLPDDPDGLMMGYQDTNGDGIDDDINRNNVYGRDGEDLGTPVADDPDTPGVDFALPPDGKIDAPADPDLLDRVNWLITFDKLQVRDHFDLAGAEINRTLHRSAHWQWFYGVRYADFREWFSLSGSGSVVSPFDLQTVAKNQIIGPQLGLRLNTTAYKFILNIENRFVPGYNHQRTAQRGRIGPENVSGQGFGAAGGPSGFVPATIMNTDNSDEFSVVYEIRADAVLPINRFTAFRMGYTGLLMSGISFASPKVHYELPDFGITDVESDETIYVNAFTVGIELNR